MCVLWYHKKTTATQNRGHRPIAATLASQFAPLQHALLAFLRFSVWAGYPEWVGSGLSAIRAVATDPIVLKCYEALDHGEDQYNFAATSCEAWFPATRTNDTKQDEPSFADEMRPLEEVIAFFQEQLKHHGRYIASPLAMRWIAPGEALLNPTFPIATFCVEIPSLRAVDGLNDLIADVRSHLKNKFQDKVRFHWGLQQDITHAEAKQVRSC